MAIIKIITINTWKCDGDYHERMESLAEGLKLLRPDVIACQECFVCEATGTDTLKFLAAKLSMDYLLVNGREKKRIFESRWVNSFSGLGILSLYPLEAYDILSLPASNEDNDRKAQQAIINLPGGENLLLTNVHLTHLRDIALRKAQVKFIADNLITITGNYIKLVCGDFNTEQDSEEMEILISTSDAIDAYVAGYGIEPRCTLIQAFKVGKNTCVDHIFALPLADNTHPYFIDSKIVLNTPGINGIFPSDHFGISTTLITS